MIVVSDATPINHLTRAGLVFILPELLSLVIIPQTDVGEREAIVLAEELGAEFLLMDEKKGRRIATDRKLTVIGTVGLIERAALRGLLDFRDALIALKATNFYIARTLENDFLNRFPD